MFGHGLQEPSLLPIGLRTASHRQSWMFYIIQMHIQIHNVYRECLFVFLLLFFCLFVGISLVVTMKDTCKRIGYLYMLSTYFV